MFVVFLIYFSERKVEGERDRKIDSGSSHNLDMCNRGNWTMTSNAQARHQRYFECDIYFSSYDLHPDSHKQLQVQMRKHEASTWKENAKCKLSVNSKSYATWRCKKIMISEIHTRVSKKQNKFHPGCYNMCAQVLPRN